jgi:hypothetical protein
MKVRILGAGPAGLYLAALMKRDDPSHDIEIFERSPRNATWGFGVVFSDRALEFLKADDQALFDYLTPHLETWPEITVVHNDTKVPVAGNGFSSIGRLELLTLLYASGLRIPVFDVVLNSSESPSLLAPKGSPTRQPSRLPTSVSCDDDIRQGLLTLR